MTDTSRLPRLDIELTCKECGKTFTARRRDAGFCSRTCYVTNYERENSEKVHARKARAQARRREQQRALHPLGEKQPPAPRPKCPPGCQCGRHTHVIYSRRELTCAECGKSFTAKRSDALYCSRECRLAQYTRENKETINAGHRRWAEAHPEVVADSQRRYQEKNAPRLAAAAKQRYAEERSDPEKRQAKQEAQRRYYQENAERLKEYARQQRVLNPNAPRRWEHGTDWRPLFKSLWDSQDGRCYLCSEPLDRDRDRGIHLDHDHSCCPAGRSCEKCRRGLSCKECNLIIGLAKDGPDKLRRIADNLERAIAVTNDRLF